MRTATLAFACLLFVAIAGCGKKAGSGGDADIAKDGEVGTSPENIDGTYKMILFSDGAKVYISIALDEKVAKKRQMWTFKDGRLTTEAASDAPLSFELDASKSPGWIDIIYPSQEKSAPEIRTYGIYTVSGDTLTISMSGGPNAKPEDRPKEFSVMGKHITQKFKKQ